MPQQIYEMRRESDSVKYMKGVTFNRIVYEWRLQKIIDGEKATQNYGVRVISNTNLLTKIIGNDY